MPRVLVIYYSQTGDAGWLATTLSAQLRAAEFDVHVERLRPRVTFPYPWKSIPRFFNIMPECLLGPVPEIEPVAFSPQDQFDLVILVYQVWFLSPSLPVQAFFKTEAAQVLNGAKVITISVSRNMWQNASETMKRLLAQAHAVHIDNVTFTHQGPPWATFITTPRALLWGKKDRFWGIFPPAGIGEGERARIELIGNAITDQRQKLQDDNPGPLLRGLNAVTVNRRYMIPEFIGWYFFRGWAKAIQRLGQIGQWARGLGIYLFVLSLVTIIVVGIPIVVVLSLVFYPLLRAWLNSYERRLAEPTGS